MTQRPEWTLLARDPLWGGGVVVLMDRLERELARMGPVARVVLGRAPGGQGPTRWGPVAMLRDAYQLRTSPSVRSARWLVFNSAMEWRPLLRDLMYLTVAPRSAGQRRALFIHGWNDDTWERVVASSVTGRLLLRRLAAVDRILVLSDTFRRALVRGGIDEGRIRVVRTCFSEADVPGNAHPERHQAPMELLYLGLLATAKGVTDLLRAAATMHKGGHAFRLTVAGDGPLRSELEVFLSDQELGGCVRLPGYLTGQGKTEALARAAILVLPSHREGLPLSVLEGMASGCAVVTTATGGLRDHFAGEADGLVFVEGRDPEGLARTLVELTADADRVIRLGDRAKTRAWADFTPEACANAFVAALDGAGA